MNTTSRRAEKRARRRDVRVQCWEYLDDERRCVDWLFEGQRDQHLEHRTDDGTVWRTPIERWGAPFPEKPSAHSLAIHRAKTPAEALRAVLAALGAASSEMAQSEQEYGWFVGHGDATTTVTELLETLEVPA